MLGAQAVLGRREILWNEPFQMLPVPVEAVSHSSGGDGGSCCLCSVGVPSAPAPRLLRVNFSNLSDFDLIWVGKWQRHGFGLQMRRATLVSTGSVCRASAFVVERNHRGFLHPCTGYGQLRAGFLHTLLPEGA